MGCFWNHIHDIVLIIQFIKSLHTSPGYIQHSLPHNHGARPTDVTWGISGIINITQHFMYLWLVIACKPHTVTYNNHCHMYITEQELLMSHSAFLNYTHDTALQAGLPIGVYSLVPTQQKGDGYFNLAC